MTQTFKTNLKCSGCVEAVKPHLDAIDGLVRWEVNLDHPDRIVKVELEDAAKLAEVETAIEAAGYKSELLPG
jgi:copper chaperone